MVISSTRHAPDNTVLQFTSARSWFALSRMRAVEGDPCKVADSANADAPFHLKGAKSAREPKTFPVSPATSDWNSGLRMKEPNQSERATKAATRRIPTIPVKIANGRNPVEDLN